MASTLMVVSVLLPTAHHHLRGLRGRALVTVVVVVVVTAPVLSPRWLGRGAVAAIAASGSAFGPRTSATMLCGKYHHTNHIDRNLIKCTYAWVRHWEARAVTVRSAVAGRRRRPFSPLVPVVSWPGRGPCSGRSRNRRVVHGSLHKDLLGVVLLHRWLGEVMVAGCMPRRLRGSGVDGLLSGRVWGCGHRDPRDRRSWRWRLRLRLRS